jgi:hypothetical protein
MVNRNDPDIALPGIRCTHPTRRRRESKASSSRKIVENEQGTVTDAKVVRSVSWSSGRWVLLAVRRNVGNSRC